MLTNRINFKSQNYKKMKTLFSKLLVLVGLAMFVGTPLLNAQTYKYVGADNCKMCHKNPKKGGQFQAWEAGPHAKAMESLKGDEKNDPKCLKCHSTAAAVDESLHAGIKKSEGVSCESCHGPGSAYKSMSVMRNHNASLQRGMIMPEKEVCIACHNEESPTFKGFDYDKYMKRISHGDPTKDKPYMERF
jgi:hypothetical protein